MIFLCPKRLGDFFVPRDKVIFFWSREVGQFIFVPRGWVIFLSKRLSDFFCPERLGNFFVSRSCVIFLSQAVG